MASCNNSQNKSESTPTDLVFSSMEILANQITEIIAVISKEKVSSMLKILLDAREKNACIFVAGAGRSGFMGKSFAMRLMHMGFKSYVVGETVTPAVQKDDVVITISGSGNTQSVVEIGKKAKNVGAVLIVLTTKYESKLGEISDLCVVLPAKSKEDKNMDKISKTPMGTSFEILSLVFLDSIIMQLIDLTGVSEDEMKKRHANME
ncbi:MAG: 6-phospho-3-hexuloisomerase [Methanimicrococcus sp.]|nr:6-phospho-3-hexuloisomerase [Methanimicrococcus sp.]